MHNKNSRKEASNKRHFNLFLVDAVNNFECLTVKNDLSEAEVCCHESLVNINSNTEGNLNNFDQIYCH